MNITQKWFFLLLCGFIGNIHPRAVYVRNYTQGNLDVTAIGYSVAKPKAMKVIAAAPKHGAYTSDVVGLAAGMGVSSVEVTGEFGTVKKDNDNKAGVTDMYIEVKISDEKKYEKYLLARALVDIIINGASSESPGLAKSLFELFSAGAKSGESIIDELQALARDKTGISYTITQKKFEKGK